MSGPQSDRYDDHRVAQHAFSIVMRTLARAFPCERKTSTPRSACWCIEVDRQGVHYSKIDPSAMCAPCRASWHSQTASGVLFGIEIDEEIAIEKANQSPSPETQT